MDDILLQELWLQQESCCRKKENKFCNWDLVAGMTFATRCLWQKNRKEKWTTHVVQSDGVGGGGSFRKIRWLTRSSSPLLKYSIQKIKQTENRKKRPVACRARGPAHSRSPLQRVETLGALYNWPPAVHCILSVFRRRRRRRRPFRANPSPPTIRAGDPPPSPLDDMEAPKNYEGTKYVRDGCSMFYPDLPDDWYNMLEVSVAVPKDTARKKCNQTHRAHAATRKVTLVPSTKVKVKASGTASRNCQAKGKEARRAAMKVDENLCTATTQETESHFTQRMLEKAGPQEVDENLCTGTTPEAESHFTERMLEKAGPQDKQDE